MAEVSDVSTRVVKLQADEDATACDQIDWQGGPGAGLSALKSAAALQSVENFHALGSELKLGIKKRAGMEGESRRPLKAKTPDLVLPVSESLSGSPTEVQFVPSMLAHPVKVSSSRLRRSQRGRPL